MVPERMIAGPQINTDAVTFRLADPHRRLSWVRLLQEVGLRASQSEFRYQADAWVLPVVRPAVDRLEYLFEIGHPNGDRETIVDPSNALRVPGAFGEKSVIEFANYRRPDWLDHSPRGWSATDFAVRTHAVGTVRGELWQERSVSRDGAGCLLLVHDGPEYASLASVIRYTAAVASNNRVLPLRVALIAPGDRNLWYAADAGYSNAIVEDVLPVLADLTSVSRRIAIGASLGALAWLHIHRTAPGHLDALFLQSGSFFHPALDPQERSFARFDEITSFVLELRAAKTDSNPVPVVLTCGLVEENLDNNRHMAATLRRLGYRTELHTVRDAHNYTAWRDALDPFLTRLITALAHDDGGYTASHRR